MKKYFNCVYNLFPVKSDDMVTADIDKLSAGILVRKKSFLPNPRKKFKFKPIVKNGRITSVKITAPYGHIVQLFRMLGFKPLISEDFFTQNIFGIETGYVYREEWENQSI